MHVKLTNITLRRLGLEQTSGEEIVQPIVIFPKQACDFPGGFRGLQGLIGIVYLSLQN